MHFSTVGDLASAASTFCLSGTTLPRRQPPSAVMTSRAFASLLRSATASAEKPPKITECTAPMRVHARMAGLAFPDERCLVASTRRNVAIQTVVTHVDLAADEPLRERLVPLQHL